MLTFTRTGLCRCAGIDVCVRMDVEALAYWYVRILPVNAAVLAGRPAPRLTYQSGVSPAAPHDLEGRPTFACSLS